MKRILYSTEDGGVAVLIPTPEYLETHTIEELAAKDVPPGVAWQIVETDTIPSDRAFRNAWCLHDGALHHDQDKCCEITKDRLRAERKPLLEAQDVLYMRAQEAGQDTTAIVAEKQRLRDVTKLVTPDMSLAAMKELHP